MTTPTQAPGWRSVLEELRDEAQENYERHLLRSARPENQGSVVWEERTEEFRQNSEALTSALAECDRLSAALAENSGPQTPVECDHPQEASSSTPAPSASGWRALEEVPSVGRKIVALYLDGSGAQLFYVAEDALIDSEGDECALLAETGNFGAWAYLPKRFRLWCEARADDPLIFPAESGADDDGSWGRHTGQNERDNLLLSALAEAEGALKRAMEWKPDRIRATSEITIGDLKSDAGIEVRLYHPDWTFLDHDWTDFCGCWDQLASALASLQRVRGDHP